MIVVLSFSYYEQSTDPVIDWLLFYNVPFVLVSVEDLVNGKGNFKIDVSSARCYLDEIDITEEIEVFFYRRFYRYLPFGKDLDLGVLSQKIHYESNLEIEEFVEYMFHMFKEKTWFPKPDVYRVNKLVINRIATEIGLKTPKSIITNNKFSFLNFYKECGNKVIYKPINRISYYTISKHTYSTYTTSVTDEIIDQLPEKFFPSLFQEKSISNYEIRVFYLDGAFYSSAILVAAKSRLVDIKQSFQSDLSTWVPYQLPKKIEEKLDKLMKRIGLVTGSIDVILDKKGTYNFIEVNPVGQYKAPSIECNYYVEKLIAEWLIKKTKNKEKYGF